jgi:hypothetical protein
LNLLGNSALDLDPASAFTNNTAGNLFQTTPNVCALLTSTGNTASGGPTITNTVSSNNVFASLQKTNTTGVSIPVTGAAPLSSTDVTLKSVISNSASGGIQLSIFTGKYVYVYSDAGLQIIAVAPASNQIAMQGAFRAY